MVALLCVGLFLPTSVLGEEKPACVRIGHRSAPTLAPENTLASVRAREDRRRRHRVRRLVHGRPKDDRPSRRSARGTTNGGDAPLREKTLAELRQFDAGSWGPWTGGKFAGEKLPLPEEMVHESLRGDEFP